jgi:hypothetical protein
MGERAGIGEIARADVVSRGDRRPIAESLPASRNHHDGAMSVMNDLAADRAEGERAEAAAAAGADDQQVRVCLRVN